MIREAYTAAQVAHADLAAALVHERRTAVALIHALADPHNVAGEAAELDDTLAEHLVARLDTRRVLREVLIRDFGCDGCAAAPDEECYPNCLPSPRNAPDQPAPADFPATVHLVQPPALHVPGDCHVFALEADADEFARASGRDALVVSTRVVSHEAALSRIAATRHDPPQD